MSRWPYAKSTERTHGETVNPTEFEKIARYQAADYLGPDHHKDVDEVLLVRCAKAGAKAALGKGTKCTQRMRA